MGKIVGVILLIAVAVGGWFVYRNYFAPPSPAYLAYQQYAEALAREQYEKAESLSVGAAQGAAAALRQGMAGSEIKVYGQNLSTRPPSIASIVGEVHSIKWNKESESGDDARVAIVVTETVCRIPPGVSSALCKWPVEFRHDVELQSVGGIWKVSSFTETRITSQQ